MRLRLLAWNTQQLVHFADDARALKIGLLLARSSYDVVALSEMFDESARAIVAGELERSGKFHVAVTRAGRERLCGLGEDSGLFVASRFPIVRARFQTFRSRSVGTDKMANKGLLLVTLQAGPHTVLVAHTHLQAHKTGAQVREMQLLEILHELQREMTTLRAKRTLAPPAILLCGDLNITDVSGAEMAGFTGEKNPFGDTREYLRLRSVLCDAFPQAQDCFRHLHPDEPGFTLDAVESTYAVFKEEDKQRMRRNEIPPERERLDYIWTLAGGAKARTAAFGSALKYVWSLAHMDHIAWPFATDDDDSEKEEVARVTALACDVARCDDLSDHWGLEAEFNLELIKGGHGMLANPATTV
jgi:endonuclease/exonuclease/phosphatase family metal-dependent hydrolase